MRHTKIIATVGPASSGEDVLRELLVAGVDVFRLNFSHGSHDTHGRTIERIRRLAADQRRCVAILQDLSGPKIRTGPLAGGQPIPLQPGDTLTIAVGDFAGTAGRVSTTYAALPRSVRPGSALLLDDGRIQLRVEETTGEELRTVVVDGGLLGQHKGINAPGVELPAAGLTAKDAADLAFGVKAGVDFIALSFVQSAVDVEQARAALGRAGAPHIPLVAKLERPEAVARMAEVVAASDAVMVARGDLGLEMPLEQVPRVQKEATRQARARGIPVIIATQVLESMRSAPRPTRAEVSDAANAVDDGVDAIMLAGETAAGDYPVRAVQTLDRIIRDAETLPAAFQVALTPEPPMAARALCEAAVMLAARAGAAAIVAVTREGRTAAMLSALRPRTPVFAATDQPEVSRRLALSWGVMPVLTDVAGAVSVVAQRIGAELVGRNAIPAASSIVLVSISPDPASETSNFLKLQRV